MSGVTLNNNEVRLCIWQCQAAQKPHGPPRTAPGPPSACLGRTATQASSGGAVFFGKESALKLGVTCTKCEWTDNNAPGTAPGAALMTLDSSGGGDVFSVDLRNSTFAGTDKDSSVCGRASAPGAPPSIQADVPTLSPLCSAPGTAACSSFCYSIIPAAAAGGRH